MTTLANARNGQEFTTRLGKIDMLIKKYNKIKKHAEKKMETYENMDHPDADYGLGAARTQFMYASQILSDLEKLKGG